MTQEQKVEVLRLKKLCFTQKEVAVKMGFSERTVKRYWKEEKSEAEEEAELAEEAKFEDTEEGWVLNYTRELGDKTPESKSWNFIYYEESAPADIEQKLKQTGLPVSLSPWHDECKWAHDSPADPTHGLLVGELYKAGDLKKKHRHGNVKYPKKISLKKAAMYIQSITCGPVPQACISEKGTEAYFSHHDTEGNPLQGKYEYDTKEVVKFNGWEAEASELEAKEMAREIENFLYKNCIGNYAEAVRSVNLVLGKEYGDIMRKFPYHFGKITDDLFHMNERTFKRLEAEEEKEREEAEEAEAFWEEKQAVKENPSNKKKTKVKEKKL